MSSGFENQDWLWTARQRRALIVLLSVLCVALGIAIVLNSRYVVDPQTGDGPRAADLATQLDPNTAAWEELAAIPRLGEPRAKAIVAYREQQQSRHPGAVVYKVVDDLTHVKGIGKATASNIKPYLVFPATRASAGDGTN